MSKLSKTTILALTDDVLDHVIKIQGTPYDRKRKVTPEMVEGMREMLSAGYGVEVVAFEYGVSTTAVKYNTDGAFRQRHLAGCSGAHTGKDNVTINDRIAYKRHLVAQGCLAV